MLSLSSESRGYRTAPAICGGRSIGQLALGRLGDEAENTADFHDWGTAEVEDRVDSAFYVIDVIRNAMIAVIASRMLRIKESSGFCLRPWWRDHRRRQDKHPRRPRVERRCFAVKTAKIKQDVGEGH